MTIDQEAERLRRVRERAFYLSLARPAPPDPVADWIEAEALEAVAEAASVEPPPAPEPPAPEPPAAEPPPPEPPAPAPLDRLGRDLRELATRLGTEEHARLSDLLASTTADPVEAEIRRDVAATRIHLLAAVARRDCLQSVGARAARTVARAEPYRCTIGPKGVSLSVEVQPELGSGLYALRTEVDAVIRRAASAREAAWQSTIWFRGELAGDRRPTTADGLAALEAELGASPSPPPGAVVLAIGNAAFDVLVAEANAESSTNLARQMLPSFKKLLETRAKDDVPFLIATVRLPLARGEAETAPPPILELVAKKASAGAALLANSASSLWLGLLELDMRAEDPRMRLVIRPAASWPLPYRDLAATLDAAIAVL